MRTSRNRRSARLPRIASALTGLAVAVGLGVTAVPAAQGAPESGDTASSTTAATASTPESTSSSTPSSTTDGPVGPPQDDFMSAFGYGLLHPDAVPTGANDWNCEPSAAHPRPVVLVHGTFENRYANWAGLSPQLKDAGYCVYALNYGGSAGSLRGLADMRDSARELADFVDRVKTASGADKVDLVGHSQGGVMPRYYINELGGAAHVENLVATTPTSHGTTLWGFAVLAKLFPGGEELVGTTCEACSQQIIGSDFLKELNADGGTHPDVDYTVIVTTYDWVVTPYTLGYLAPAPNVTNESLQRHCLNNTAEHLGVSYDDTANALVMGALDPAGAQRPAC
ncbi:triacylglycerol lipase [Streptomyces sp. JJ38]|uniref:esterase/lipase family protein n=1 Tax=Streptomyces sp. JJ38 TaxID=2738128 RepID=UPI001C590A93|nr:alpha/beta fold hydrolase [Streptomyces sp. JJ38]MBW1597790.1 alpha/beta fold hydrolase [Streptomyces sp. JJ38]